MQISRSSRAGRQLLSSADRSAIAVAEKLEDSAGPLGAKALVAESPTSPGLSSPPPPPSPPSCTRTPIEAYCLPFRERNGRTGCLAKVAKADPGSEVWFKLQFTSGAWIRSYVKLEKNATYGHSFFYLEESLFTKKTIPSLTTGKAVYKEEFDCSWPVLSTDPSTETTYMGRVFVRGTSVTAAQYQTKVPVGNGKFVTIDRYERFDMA